MQRALAVDFDQPPCEFISVAYGVAPKQGFCVLALTLKERASELFGIEPPNHWNLLKIKDDSYPAWESIEILKICFLSLSLPPSRDLNFELHGVECRARAMYR